MSNRTANYTAFYVAEPFDSSNLRAHAAPDFCHYHLLQAWKRTDCSFPFVDAHAKTYNVRDGSAWETLKERLHSRLNLSKNIILFLSSYTKHSRALVEEIDYGINKKGLPVIVIYPDFKQEYEIANVMGIRKQVENLWDKLPIFRDSMCKVPTIHLPFDKDLIIRALQDEDFKVQTKGDPGRYYY